MAPAPAPAVAPAVAPALAGVAAGGAGGAEKIQDFLLFYPDRTIALNRNQRPTFAHFVR